MKPAAILLSVVCTFVALTGSEGASRTPLPPEIPRVWDEAALAEWATPLAGLNARPTHMSPTEYYATPVDNLKTYPVYTPGREPAGYWEMLVRGHQFGLDLTPSERAQLIAFLRTL